MAIGDIPNQNLFGTNYNPEDEEEKRARLAAQGAMMGSGDQSFRGATGIQDIAGIQGVPQGGTLDPTQGARDLLIGRQFNRGEPIRISDMGSLIQAPQGVPALDSNIVAQVPGIENIKNPGAFNPPEPALKNALLGMLERADEREAQGLPRQAAPGIIDAPSGALALGATPSVTPPVETPSVGAQEQPGAVVSPFLQSPDTPSGLGGPLLDGFNRVNDSFRAPNAPMGQDATRAALGGMTLNEYLNAPAGTEGVSGLRTDPQGRMIPAGFETRAEAFPSYEANAAQREARLDARPDFGKAVSDRDRRAARGDDISMADQIAMAKANARDATPTEVARGNQVANALGVDLETGQPPEATGAFKPSDILARERFEYDKQQDLIDDDTSDNATTRKIATIKQANPDISDADAAAIASGSVRVVTNDLTGVTQLLNIATGESRQIQSQPAPAVDFDVALPEETLFSRAGDFTGFVEATKRKAQGITGQVGLDVATEESLGAAQDFETAQNELVRAFRESSRYAASEAAALKKELNISLSPFEDPKSAEAKLRSIDKSLDRRYENEVATFRDTSFPPSDRQDARMRAKAIAEFRANLGVPPEGQGSTSSTQGKVPQGVDPKDWEFMSPEQRNLFN